MSRELVSELEGLVRQHPLRERLTGQLMLGLYRSGRQAESLRAYQSLSGRLAEELGIEPSASLRKLEERIVTDDAGLDTISSSALAGSDNERGNGRGNDRDSGVEHDSQDRNRNGHRG